jgi:glycosyltransferase involved in cell wall biosynthesis
LEEFQKAAMMNKHLCIIGNPNIIHTRRWAADFIEKGWRVTLVGEHDPRILPSQKCCLIDLTKVTNLPKIRYLIWSQHLRKIIRKINPDILHCISVSSAGWLGAATNYHPLLITSIGSDLMLLEKKSLFHQALSKWSIHKADYLICVSDPLRQKAVQLGISSSKIKVISLGVRDEIFHPTDSKTALRQELDIPERPVILCLRALQHIYQPLLIAEAIPKILSKVPEALFLVFLYNADSLLLENFRNKIADNHVENAVIYIPPQANDENIAKYYQAADIAVSIPLSDGMPVSVQEAMACEIALVLTDLPNLRGWLHHEQEAIILPRHTENPQNLVSKLVDSVIRLLTDSCFRINLQKNARNVILANGRRIDTINRVEEIYTRLISGN